MLSWASTRHAFLHHRAHVGLPSIAAAVASGDFDLPGQPGEGLLRRASAAFGV
jgi:hypothetical protein